MKFIVKAEEFKNSIEKEIDTNSLYQLLTNLWNDCAPVSAHVPVTVDDMKRLFAIMVNMGVRYNAMSNTYTFSRFSEGFPFNFKIQGSFKDDCFEVSAVEIDEANYPAKTINGEKQKNAIALAQTIFATSDSPAQTETIKIALANEPKPEPSKLRTYLNGVKYYALLAMPYTIMSACISVGLTVAAIATPLIAFGAAFGLTMTSYAIREWFKSSQTKKFKESLPNASIDRLHAFLDGVEAQKSTIAQVKTLVNSNTYRNWDAYYAGMDAQVENKERRIQNVKSRIKLSA